MPSTFQIYLDLLLDKLTNGSNEPVEISDEQMQQAIAEVKNQIKQKGPQPDKLDEEFINFCNGHPKPENCRKLRPDSNTIGPDNISRYEYSERCRNEVMKNVEMRARQALEWRSTVKRIGLTNEDGTIKSVPMGRWLGQLLKTDGSDESLRFNESVVTLAALGNNVISKDEYLNIRKDYYIKKENKPEAEAEKSAQNDFDNRAEFLYAEVEKAIDHDRDKLNSYKDAALAIMNGNFSKFGGSMTQAFNVFLGYSESLAMVGINMFEELTQKFGLVRTPEQKNEITLRWQDYTTPVNGYENLAEQVSNPYFAIFDPYKYYRQTSSVDTLIPSTEAERQNELAYGFMHDGMAYFNIASRSVNETLKQYGLNAGNEVIADRTDEYNVYENDGRVAILKIGKMTADEITTNNDEYMPEKIVIQGTATAANSLVERCAGWSKKHRTSREFENMRASLEEITKLGFDKNGDFEDKITTSAEKFEELRADAKAYLAHKLKQHPDKKWDGDYETARVNFALDVLDFAEKKMRQIGYYSRCRSTRIMRTKAELEAQIHPEWKNDPKYAGMSAVEHELEAKRELIAKAEKAENAKREALQKEQRDAEMAVKLEDGRRSAEGYDKLFNGLDGNVGELDAARNTVEQFAAEQKKAYDAEMTTIETEKLFLPGDKKWNKNMDIAVRNMFNNAKYLIAGFVIAELINGEEARNDNLRNNGKENEIKTPIRQLVNAGKTKELAELIIASAYFRSKFSERLSEPESVNKLIEERNAPSKRTRIECFGVGKEFLENIELAKQNPIVEQNAAPENKEKNREEPENNNHINIIDDDKNVDNKNGNDEELDEAVYDIVPEKDMSKPCAKEPALFKSMLAKRFEEAKETAERDKTAEIILNRHIASSMKVYRFYSPNSDKSVYRKVAIEQSAMALAGATLKYMIKKEAPSEVLRDAVERGQTFSMLQLIIESGPFNENFKNFSPENVNMMLDDEEFFCRPVGDALLELAKDVIKPESVRVALQRSKEDAEKAKSGSNLTDDEKKIQKDICKKFDDVIKFTDLYEKCDWVEDTQPYAASPSEKYLNEKIERCQSSYETFISHGSRVLACQNVVGALTAATMKYMITNDPTGFVLETLVQNNQYLQLEDMISQSPLFKKKYEKIDTNNEEQVSDYIDDVSLLIKPLGEELLDTLSTPLKQAVPKIAEIYKSDMLKKLKNDINEYKKMSDKAFADGNPDEAENYAAETLAMQTTSVLLLSVNEKGKMPNCTVSTMVHRVFESKQFSDMLDKYDLKKPGELNRAISERASVGVVKSIVAEQKQKTKEANELAAGKAKVTHVNPENPQAQNKM